MRSRQQDRDGTITINGAVTASGTVSSGSGFQVTKSGTGAYSVRFPQMRALLNAVSTPAVGAFVGSSITQPNFMGVVTYNSAAAPTDIAFSFSATGLSA